MSIQLPFAVKGLALIFFLCAAIRVFSALGADSASKNYMTGLVSNDDIVDSILNFELGALGQTDSDVTLATLLLGSSILAPDTAAVDLSTTAAPDASAALTENTGDTTNVGDIALYFNNWETPNNSTAAKPNIITTPAAATNADHISVINKTDYTVDTAALLKAPLDITLSGDSPVVLVIQTHGSEAYMPDATSQYIESDPYRTQDMSQTVMRVGDELVAALEKAGISVIHDKGIYDYPSYKASYTNSYAAIQSILKKYPSIKIVIDIHRDHIPGDDGAVYKTIADIGDTPCAQVKFVMGTSFSGLKHPNWRENFKLALHIQNEMNKLYPSLAKPIELSQYRYNQQATIGSMILEVGCTGNTLQESLSAVRYFADAFSEVVLDLYK